MTYYQKTYQETYDVLEEEEVIIRGLQDIEYLIWTSVHDDEVVAFEKEKTKLKKKLEKVRNGEKNND